MKSINKFKALLREKNILFTEENGKITIDNNNGGDVYLSSLTSLPENTTFNNGGDVYLKNTKIKINTSYLTRFNIEKKRGFVILYKRVSSNFKTQEGTENETSWVIGTTLEHQNWNPAKNECGGGKFHACAKPHWCDVFRNKKSDKYIAIKINVKDLYEWTGNSAYPSKISFRKGKVIGEVGRIV